MTTICENLVSNRDIPQGQYLPYPKKEIVSLAITLRNEEKKIIKIYSDSKPEKVAYEFCLKNNLDFEELKELTTQIRNAFLSYDIQSAHSVNNNSKYNPQYNNYNRNKEKQYKRKEYVDLNKKEKLNEDEKEENVINENEMNQLNKNQNDAHFKGTAIYKKIKNKNINKKSKHSYLENTLSSNMKKHLIPSRLRSNQQSKSVIERISTTSLSKIKNIPKNKDDDDEILNFGERLYHKEMKLNEKREEKLQLLKKKIENKNKKNNTFKPKVNNISYNALANRISNKLSFNDEDKIIYYKEYKMGKINDLSKKYNNDKQYTFKPKLNKRSVTLEKNRQKPKTPRYEQLFQNYKKKQVDIKELTNKYYNKSVLFIPKVNDYSCPYTNITFDERQKAYISKSQEKQRELKKKLERPFDTQTGQRFFHPEVNEYNRPDNYNIFDNLYQQSFQLEAKRKKMAELICINEKNNQLSHVNEESKGIYQKQKDKAFKKIFNVLDKEQEGIITKININVKGLPITIQKILTPLINELKEEDETLNLNEFTTACNHLFEMLSYLEKKEIVQYGIEKKTKKEFSSNFTFKPQIMQYIPISIQRIRNVNNKNYESDKSLNTSQIENSKMIKQDVQ